MLSIQPSFNGERFLNYWVIFLEQNRFEHLRFTWRQNRILNCIQSSDIVDCPRDLFLLHFSNKSRYSFYSFLWQKLFIFSCIILLCTFIAHCVFIQFEKLDYFAVGVFIWFIDKGCTSGKLFFLERNNFPVVQILNEFSIGCYAQSESWE